MGKLKKKKNQTVSFLSSIYLPRIEIIGFYDVQAVSSVVERLALNQEAVSSILTPLRIKKKIRVSGQQTDPSTETSVTALYLKLRRIAPRASITRT